MNKLASSIIADQKKQITEMSAWLQSWYGKQADETAMAMPGMDKLSAASGAEFDKLFLSLMGEHHQGALDMAKLVSTRADHAELLIFRKAKCVAEKYENRLSSLRIQKVGFGGPSLLS